MKTRIDSHSGLFLTLAEWELLDALQDAGCDVEAVVYVNDHSVAVNGYDAALFWSVLAKNRYVDGHVFEFDANSLLSGSLLLEFDRSPRSVAPSPTTAVVNGDCTAEDWEQFHFDVRVERVLSQLRWNEILRVEDLLSGDAGIDENAFSDDDYDLIGRESQWSGPELIVCG